MGQKQSRSDVSPTNAFASSGNSSEGKDEDQPLFPDPTGHEYDEIDKLQAELPSIIDEESRQQVEDYAQACDDGKGPMVACFATAEYISMFERRVSHSFFHCSNSHILNPILTITGPLIRTAQRGV